MVCVETVEYSSLVNENVVETIPPDRGMRLGEPLLPYLFVICA